jgi:hypothetical protein
MIPADVLNTLKALALTQKPLVTATPPAAGSNTAFEPGQKYQGVVQAQVAPGIFKVQVAEQLLQMQLPSNIRSGDKIMLQVVSLIPRLAFTMAASSNPLSTPDQLSSTARLLSSLSQQPVEKSYVRSAQSAPLWTGKMQFPDPAELADKLHETISQSGLFYESHQAQWLQGTRSTTQLLDEPQNKPAPSESNAQTRASATSDTRTRESNAPLRTDSANSQSSTGVGNEQRATSSIPQHLQPLVQQQLNALETRQVQWQGQVWPNQEMNWKIHEESSRNPRGAEERQWATQIQLDLPNLGTVSAMLRFGSSGLSLTLDATDSATRAKLGNASSKLLAALGERGITTASALVTQHDNP